MNKVKTRGLFSSGREDLQQRATTKQVYVLVREEFESEIPLTAHKSSALTDSDTLPRLRASIFWYPGISEWYVPDSNIGFRDIFNVPYTCSNLFSKINANCVDQN